VILVGEMVTSRRSSTALTGRRPDTSVRDLAHPGRAAVDRPRVDVYRRTSSSRCGCSLGLRCGDLHAADIPTGRAESRDRCEVMVRRPRCGTIREGKTHQLYSGAPGRRSIAWFDGHVARMQTLAYLCISMEMALRKVKHEKTSAEYEKRLSRCPTTFATKSGESRQARQGQLEAENATLVVSKLR